VTPLALGPQPLQQGSLPEPPDDPAVGGGTQVLTLVGRDDQIESLTLGAGGGGGVDPSFDRGLLPVALDLAGLERRAGGKGDERGTLRLTVEVGRCGQGGFLLGGGARSDHETGDDTGW
jgi:hypothetical protein